MAGRKHRKRMFCNINRICNDGEMYLERADKKFYQLRHAYSRLSRETIQKHKSDFDDLLSDLMRHNTACRVCDIDFYSDLSEHLEDLFPGDSTFQTPIVRSWGTSYERCDHGIVYVYAIDRARDYAAHYQRTREYSSTERFHRMRFYNIITAFKEHESTCKICRASFLDEYIESLIPFELVPEYRGTVDKPPQDT